MHDIVRMTIFNSVYQLSKDEFNSTLSESIIEDVHVIQQVHLKFLCQDEHVVIFIEEILALNDVLMIQRL